jgi:FdhD protein
VNHERIVTVIDGTTSREKADCVAVEEPLAVQIAFGPVKARRRVTLSVTMRTPGHDADLAAGLLVSEGVVKERGDVLGIDAGIFPLGARPARPPSSHGSNAFDDTHSPRDRVGDAAGTAALPGENNLVRVELHPDVPVDLVRLERYGFTSSACGVCGKTSLDAVEAACDGPAPGGRKVSAVVLHALPERLRAAQPGFAQTGGIHAAALFDMDGTLLAVREDVGRHNAVDKLIGAEFLAGRVPLCERVLFVSGRAGFELVQKAAVAGVPVFAAVGAPTTLAVELAERLGVTLLGFVRDGRFNVYCGIERLAL